MLKTCCTCKQVKSIEEFHKGAFSCKPCAISRAKIAREKRRQDPEYVKQFNAKTVARLQEHKQKAVDYKGNKCFDCGQSFPNCVYDFHHINPNTKDMNPSDIVRLGFEKAKTELDKCVMLCANCHRLRHFFRKSDEGIN